MTKIIIPPGWGGALVGEAQKASESSPRRSGVREPTEDEMEWLAKLLPFLHSTLLACRAQHPEFQFNLAFLSESCRALLLAYTFGEESIDNVLRYTASIMRHFGMPAIWRYSVLGILAEGVVTAQPRSRVKGRRGEPLWLAFSCGAVVEVHMVQGLKQGPAAEEALKLLKALGLPHEIKLDTVKRWHQMYRASKGLDPLPRGRPRKQDLAP